VAALLTYACGDDEGSDSPGAGGGSDAGSTGAGEAGERTTGAGGEGGAGGNRSDGLAGGGAGGEGGQRAQCGPYPLSELCDDQAQTCPPSPDEVPLDYCHVESIERFASDCGGTIVRRSEPLFFTTTYSFDSDGTLIGVLAENDSTHDCQDGGFFLYDRLR
jgi:hypothetical protein